MASPPAVPLQRLPHPRGILRPVAFFVSLAGAWLLGRMTHPGLVPGPPALGLARVRSRWWRREASDGQPLYDEGTVPLNFRRAFKSDKEALRRWRNTLAWRRAEGVDAILHEPNDLFYVMKKHYPHALHYPDREGHLTYWELPGKLNVQGLKRSGATPDRGLRHYIWHTEYTWRVACPKDGAQTTVIFDAKGVGWDTLSIELIELMKRIVRFTNEHYPQRAARIIVLNTPGWYSTLHAMLRPFMSDICQSKLVLLSEADVLAGKLTKWIAPANLPVAYGGKSKTPIGESKYEKAMRSYVDRANRRAGVKAVTPK